MENKNVYFNVFLKGKDVVNIAKEQKIDYFIEEDGLFPDSYANKDVGYANIINILALGYIRCQNNILADKNVQTTSQELGHIMLGTLGLILMNFEKVFYQIEEKKFSIPESFAEMDPVNLNRFTDVWYYYVYEKKDTLDFPQDTYVAYSTKGRSPVNGLSAVFYDLSPRNSPLTQMSSYMILFMELIKRLDTEESLITLVIYMDNILQLEKSYGLDSEEKLKMQILGNRMFIKEAITNNNYLPIGVPFIDDYIKNNSQKFKAIGLAL
jgi:hypothetical protein